MAAPARSVRAAAEGPGAGGQLGPGDARGSGGSEHPAQAGLRPSAAIGCEAALRSRRRPMGPPRAVRMLGCGRGAGAGCGRREGLGRALPGRGLGRGLCRGFPGARARGRSAAGLSRGAGGVRARPGFPGASARGRVRARRGFPEARTPGRGQVLNGRDPHFVRPWRPLGAGPSDGNPDPREEARRTQSRCGFIRVSVRDTNTPGPAPIGWRKQAQRGSATPQGHTESACLPEKEGLASAFLDSHPASSPALRPPL